MAKSRGQEFEDAFRASVPDSVFCKKLHTPAPPPTQIDLIVEHLRRTRPRPERGQDWMVATVERMKFTARQGFDVLVAPGIPVPSGAGFGVEARDIHGAPFFLEAKPVILFCLEMKSTQGKRLDFSRLKEHQEDALRREALAGRIAGLAVEFADVLAPSTEREMLISDDDKLGDVLFLPILSYLAYKRDCRRASIPYDVAERIGLRIEIDVDRGRVRRYYKVGKFLRAFGAGIEDPEPRATANSAAATSTRNEAADLGAEVNPAGQLA